MKLTEFVGGFITGISLLFISLGVIFLDILESRETTVSASYYYLELVIPYIAAIIAGLGLGFGLKSDEGGLNFSFTFDIGEQWPTLIGAMSLAVVFGASLLLFISATPTLGIFLELIASVLATFGLLIVIVAWENYGF